MFKRKLLATIVGALALSSISVANAVEVKETHDYSHRSEANQLRDEYRKPLETLDFFGIETDDKVVEILPGGGWYTEVLAPYLSQGELVAAHYPADNPVEYRARSRANFEEKVSNSDVYKNVVVTDFAFGESVSEEAKGADAVLVFRALHGMQNQGTLAEAFVKFKEMLNEDGVLGIVQHEAPEGYSAVESAKKGYLPKSHVIAVAEAAGFELVSESYMHNNPKDHILKDSVEQGVWALPPSLRAEGMEEEMKKVGESNRMTLLFKLR